MSAVRALKPMSTRDMLIKTVRLITRSGIDVQFRGRTPMVLANAETGEIKTMILPELPDEISEDLMAAIHGFIDHECGHVFFTPFKQMNEFINAKGKAQKAYRHAFQNVVDDIRLEKLQPRKLPGTAENLRRMYEWAIPNMMGPPVFEGLDPNGKPERNAMVVLVVALRALAGQRPFQVFMDDNKLWHYFEPVLQAVPNLQQDLLDMETFDDVERLVEKIIDGLGPKDLESVPPPPSPGDDEADTQPDQEGREGGEEDEADADETDNTTDEDGEGCDDAQDEDSDEEGDAGTEGQRGDEADEDGEAEDGGDEEDDGAGEDGEVGSLTEALKKLEPIKRNALYAYNKQGKSIDEIAEQFDKTDNEIKTILREARRDLNRIMKQGD